MLATRHLDAGQVVQRIRLLSMASRHKHPRHFQAVAHAVLQRHRLRIDYYNRELDEISTRIISPQRLAHYRDNWYLDAWCHKKKGVRSFAVECIRAVEPLAKPAKGISEAQLDREFATSYGIFAGQPLATAVLRFTPKRARWVAAETWHPQQQGRWLEDHSYELSIPYSDDRELLMDILKYGPDVEVVAPEALREAVKSLHEFAASQYRRGDPAGSGFEAGGG